MSVNVAQLQGYISAGLNILVTGPAGTGKTAMLTKASNNLGYNVKYFSAATMDPIIDLIGIPSPDKETDSMKFYRPKDIDDADIIFIDELNRAPVSVLNAVFELIQFKSVNGAPLPRLKSVVAAINPVSDEYTTDELDLALVDRFHCYLETSITADYSYLKNKFGATYARAGVSMFNEYQRNYTNSLRSSENTLGYFSPRRLEILLDVFKQFPTPETVKTVLPNDVAVSHRAVASNLNAALTPSVKTSSKTTQAKKIINPEDTLDQLVSLSPRDFRLKRYAEPAIECFEWAKENNPTKAAKLLSSIAIGLSYGVGPKVIFDTWGPVVREFNYTQRRMMMSGWTYYKTAQVNELFDW